MGTESYSPWLTTTPCLLNLEFVKYPGDYPEYTCEVLQKLYVTRQIDLEDLISNVGMKEIERNMNKFTIDFDVLATSASLCRSLSQKTYRDVLVKTKSIRKIKDLQVNTTKTTTACGEGRLTKTTRSRPARAAIGKPPTVVTRSNPNVVSNRSIHVSPVSDVVTDTATTSTRRPHTVVTRSNSTNVVSKSSKHVVTNTTTTAGVPSNSQLTIAARKHPSVVTRTTAGNQEMLKC